MFSTVNLFAMSHILDTIVEAKRQEVQQLHQQFWVSDFEKMPGYQRTTLSLSKRLQQTDSTGIIAEFKRKSPSKGFFTLPNKAVEPIVEAYAQHAAGISVLTDSEFFGGTLKDLQTASATAGVPLLRKDFIIDPLQIHQAKAFGADVILLIAAIPTPQQVRAFVTLAKSIGLETLLELHDEGELGHICDEINMIGINNRNLQTFEVSINTSLQLIQKLPADKPAVSESGISNVGSIVTLRQAGYRGFLIGEHFMRQPDPAIAFAQFIQALAPQKTEIGQ
jgi:indole-3-glycerol phosphate synthase